MDLTLLARERVGNVLRGKYHLDRLIDVGGMAAVYEATHRNGTRSAIKVLHPKYVSDVQARTRFLREGYAANHVGHPGSVTVLDDDFTEEGEVYLVMELLDGESLEGCISREKQMDEVDVLSIADQLLDVLSSAHHKDIIHRDIKPANIMLTRSGIVKLLDFGLARVRELPAVAGVHSAEIVFGTVAYVSPEAARANNDEMDGRADLWAVAATMFKALAGETVHGMDGSVMERLIRAARNQARSLGDVMPHLHPRVIDVVDRALMFHPGDRWPSAAVMQAVVQDVLAQLMEERAVPPSLFFMPGLSQAAAGYTASGPMSSTSAMATPTPRPYRGQVPTPSPSPYPHPGLPAQPVNPLNQVARNPLNQVRGRPVRQSQQPQPQPQQGYVNPLNQVASRRPVQVQAQPRAQRRPVNPLNQISTRPGAQWRSQNEPQNRGPASYTQVARGQNHAPTSSDSSFEIDIDDLDGGADLSYNALDVTITVEEDVQNEPATRPRRATTMRDLGSAAARARAMLDARRKRKTVEPEPEADDFEIDLGFDGDGADDLSEIELDDLEDMSQEEFMPDFDEDDDGQLAGTQEDTVRRPPPSLPSEETVRRRAPTGPPLGNEDEAHRRLTGTVSGEVETSAPGGMDSGIIIEELDGEDAWPENDLWDLPAVPEYSGQSQSAVAEADKPVSGLLGMPPLVTGAGPTKVEREAEVAAKQRAAADKRAAASATRRADLEAARAAAAAKRAEIRERREASAREASARREEERRRRAEASSAPPVTGARKTGLDRLAGLRRPGKTPSAPMVIDSDSSMSTPPDRTVRFSIRAPATLPDLEARRSKPAPAPLLPTGEGGGKEEVAELSDSMFIHVPEGATSKPVAPLPKTGPPRRASVPQRTPVPPQRTPVPPQRTSTSQRTPVPPLRTPSPPQRSKPAPQRKPAKKDDESLKTLRLPHLRKPPRDK